MISIYGSTTPSLPSTHLLFSGTPTLELPRLAATVQFYPLPWVVILCSVYQHKNILPFPSTCILLLRLVTLQKYLQFPVSKQPKLPNYPPLHNRPSTLSQVIFKIFPPLLCDNKDQQKCLDVVNTTNKQPRSAQPSHLYTQTIIRQYPVTFTPKPSSGSTQSPLHPNHHQAVLPPLHHHDHQQPDSSTSPGHPHEQQQQKQQHYQLHNNNNTINNNNSQHQPQHLQQHHSTQSAPTSTATTTSLNTVNTSLNNKKQHYNNSNINISDR